ncbi:melanocortin-2 receptor accessory protein-like [Ictalurus punctatus]|uniref:Melanocortin-2 receptor accessory protein-like n=1 Tax=Ictalurus punctatus TaxID=7998 RepID=A0A979FB49_ICTPU|nr:melanocortin-2 receptor accessory protein-like [Ictalurus punctatus]
MEKSTNSSAYELTYEYYYDYIDPVAVDASKLNYNRYCIVIIFWIAMAAFIGLLFLILSSISGTKHLPRHQSSKRKPRRERRSSSKPVG